MMDCLVINELLEIQLEIETLYTATITQKTYQDISMLIHQRFKNSNIYYLKDSLLTYETNKYNMFYEGVLKSFWDTKRDIYKNVIFYIYYITLIKIGIGNYKSCEKCLKYNSNDERCKVVECITCKCNEMIQYYTMETEDKDKNMEWAMATITKMINTEEANVIKIKFNKLYDYVRSVEIGLKANEFCEGKMGLYILSASRMEVMVINNMYGNYKLGCIGYDKYSFSSGLNETGIKATTKNTDKEVIVLECDVVEKSEIIKGQLNVIITDHSQQENIKEILAMIRLLSTEQNYGIIAYGSEIGTKTIYYDAIQCRLEEKNKIYKVFEDKILTDSIGHMWLNYEDYSNIELDQAKHLALKHGLNKRVCETVAKLAGWKSHSKIKYRYYDEQGQLFKYFMMVILEMCRITHKAVVCPAILFSETEKYRHYINGVQFMASTFLSLCMEKETKNIIMIKQHPKVELAKFITSIMQLKSDEETVVTQVKRMNKIDGDMEAIMSLLIKLKRYGANIVTKQTTFVNSLFMRIEISKTHQVQDFIIKNMLAESAASIDPDASIVVSYIIHKDKDRNNELDWYYGKREIRKVKSCALNKELAMPTEIKWANNNCIRINTNIGITLHPLLVSIMIMNLGEYETSLKLSKKYINADSFERVCGERCDGTMCT